MKTLTMDGVQLHQDKNNYRVVVAHSMTNNPSLSELENLKNTGEKYFEVESITQRENKNRPHRGEKLPHREDGDYVITYKVPMAAKSLLSIKSSNEILKLSILNEVLIDNLLEQQDVIKPMIHPANIFFMDMKTVRYLYCSNGELHNSSVPVLEQYKALVVSMLTKYSFEKMLYAATRKEVLQKANNVFLIQIEKCTTVAELQEMIQNRLNKIESDFFIFRDKEDRAKKQKRATQLTVLTIGVIVCAVLLALVLWRVL